MSKRKKQPSGNAYVDRVTREGDAIEPFFQKVLAELKTETRGMFSFDWEAIEVYHIGIYVVAWVARPTSTVNPIVAWSLEWSWLLEQLPSKFWNTRFIYTPEYERALNNHINTMLWDMSGLRTTTFINTGYDDDEENYRWARY